MGNFYPLIIRPRLLKIPRMWAPTSSKFMTPFWSSKIDMTGPTLKDEKRFSCVKRNDCQVIRSSKRFIIQFQGYYLLVSVTHWILSPTMIQVS